MSSFNPYQECILEYKHLLFGTLSHYEKCRGFGLFFRTFLFWEFVISFFFLWFICLNEINPWAYVCVINSFCSISCFLVHVLNFENKSFVDLFLWYYLDNKCVLPQTFMPSCISKCFLQMVSSMDLESLVYSYFQYEYHSIFLAFFDPIYMAYCIKP
jgi:hypothetical protein